MSTSLAEALTESAVNVAHVARTLHDDAEIDPSSGRWIVDKESMKALSVAIRAWSAAGDRLLRGGQGDERLPEPTSTMWRWSTTEGADRPLTRHDLALDGFQSALVVFHGWSVCAARLVREGANVLSIAVARGEVRFPTAQDLDTVAVQVGRALAVVGAERNRLLALATAAGVEHPCRRPPTMDELWLNPETRGLAHLDTDHSA